MYLGNIPLSWLARTSCFKVKNIVMFMTLRLKYWDFIRKLNCSENDFNIQGFHSANIWFSWLFKERNLWYIIGHILTLQPDTATEYQVIFLRATHNQRELDIQRFKTFETWASDWEENQMCCAEKNLSDTFGSVFNQNIQNYLTKSANISSHF